MALQGQAPGGELPRLVVAQAGRGAFVFGHGGIGQSATGHGHEHAGFVRDVPGRHDQGFPVQVERVRGDDPVHGVGPEAPDGVDQHVARMGVFGQARVEHAGGFGRHHGEAGGGHGHVVVRDALEQPVGHGPGGIEACDDELVGAVQPVRGHAEHGQVLAGKGEFPVLADGARAHSKAGGRSRTGGEDGLGRVRNGLPHDLGQGRAQDGGLDVLGRGGQAGRIVRGDAEPDAGDRLEQSGLFEKGPERGRSHGETGRHGQAGPVGDLAEIGAFAAGGVHHFARDLGQVEHELAPVGIDPAADGGLDFVREPADQGHQFGLGPAGQTLEALDHADGVENGPAGPGADKGHAEDFMSVEHHLHLGTDLEQLGVGFQQRLKMVVFFAKDGGCFSPGWGMAATGQAGDKGAQAAKHGAHGYAPWSGLGATAAPGGRDSLLRPGGFPDRIGVPPVASGARRSTWVRIWRS